MSHGQFMIVRRLNSMIIDYPTIYDAVERVQSNTNAIQGLIGEQRVREAIPTQFVNNVVTGCWLVSNYTEGTTRHLLLMPHTHQPENPLSDAIDMESIPDEVIALRTLAQNLGIPTYYCMPFLFQDPDLPRDNATNPELEEYLVSRNLTKSGTKAVKIERINSIFSKIEYGCVNIANPESIISLVDVLRSHGFPEKAGGPKRFAASVNQNITGLNRTTITEEFWKRHLWWKVKSLTSSHCADIDALYISDENVIPIEIKTKSIAGRYTNTPYFGIDVGTIAKMLKFSELGTGQGEGIYIVEEREGQNPPIAYHATTMSNLYANMELHTGGGGASGFGGGGTEVVKVPMHTFQIMDTEFFENLMTPTNRLKLLGPLFFSAIIVLYILLYVV